MPFGIFGARFDRAEFVLGLILGILLFWLVRRTKPAFDLLFEWVQERSKSLLESLTSSSEEPYTQDLLFRLENLHLASPLFPFREVLVPPRLLIPPPPTDPAQDEQTEDLYPVVLPALPDWNALEAIYQTPSVPVSRLLKSGDNVLITGEIGSGKTSALASLAILILVGEIPDETERPKLPIFLHAADLNIPPKAIKDPLDIVMDAVRRTSTISLSGLMPRYLQHQLHERQAILLLDGLDELTIEEIRPIVGWLQEFHSRYPQHQIVAAGPPRGYDGILEVGLFPVSIAPWNTYDLEHYLNRWALAWQNNVVPNLPKDRVGEIDPILLNSWMRISKIGINPLEVTIKVWSFYVGDTQGPTMENCLQSYVRRILSPNEQHAAQAIALTWIRTRRSTIAASPFEKRAPLQDLIDAHLLRRSMNDQIGFSNPSVGAFLAAGAMLLTKKVSFDPKDYWEPARAAIRFFSVLGDTTALVNHAIQPTEDQLHTSLLTCASWIPKSKSDAPWRNKVLGVMAKIIQNENQPYGIRLRIVQALIAADEQPAKSLFLHMLKSESSESRILGILGLGGLRNEDNIDALQKQIEIDGDQRVRFSACLGLAAIGNTKALQVLGRFMLAGDDLIQLFASIALASHPGEGVPMLRDALKMESVRVRRAAVYGLNRVQSEEVIEILQKVQIEDDQAIVRNAAAEVLELRLSPKFRLASPAPQVSSLPWLIAYAAKSGMGVTPGKGALEMLRRVFIDGDKLQKVAALEAVGFFGVQALTLETTQALQSQDAVVRRSAFEALWRLEAAGIKTPSTRNSTSNRIPEQRIADKN